MNKSLVVVESPAKAKTIEKFLGKNFLVKASFGHLRDLPKSQFGVDIENHFEPKYINIRGKGELIKTLKTAAKEAKNVYLATDPDREGEAIAWHLAHILSIPDKTTCRIEFNEITKPAIQQAVKKPRRIDSSRVLAQQTRRILDRIVGYKLSPLLWRKVRKGLSAGRVQSVAVRIICDREKEIQNFVAEEYWTITALLEAEVKEFDALLINFEGEKIKIDNGNQTKKIIAEIEKQDYIVESVKKRERKRNPYPPFTTSSLQQEASRKLGFTSKKTMLIAQQLYEGLDIGSLGQVGLITYMRTDSTRIAETAQAEAREFIKEKFGEPFLPEKPPVYVTKKSQDAHEAIRPTDVRLTPNSIVSNLSKEQYKTYKLIWERFVASQMTPAIYDTLTVDITAGKYTFRATGSQLKFPGYQAAFGIVKTKKKEKEELDTDINEETALLDQEKLLPKLEPGQKLKLSQLLPKQHFTEPPPRFTEATLVKTMEEKGIGRPSTYAPTIDTIVTRGYVKRVEKKFEPTELGFVVVDLLKEYFKEIVDVEFTAVMEDRLDEVAEGEISWTDVLEKFYEPFIKELTHAEEAIGQVELPVQVSDVPCENCGQMMVIKQGRYGDFLACPGFPKCRNTKPILKLTEAACPKCGGAIAQRNTKRGRVFYGCEKYPGCDFTTWDQPLKETCPTCQSFMIKQKSKNSENLAMRCGNPDCLSNQALLGQNNRRSESVKNKAANKPVKKRGRKSG